MLIKSETKRLLQVIELLERTNNAKQIADKLGAYPSAITDLKKGRTNVGSKLIQKFTKKYDVNPDWLFTGDGEMFTTQTKSATTGNGQGKMYVEDLVPEIMRLKEQNKLLQDEYRFLSDEVRAMKEKMLESLKEMAKSVRKPKKQKPPTPIKQEKGSKIDAK